jgi:hypothetical protein
MIQRTEKESMMDRNELVETLRRSRVPDALYDIPGVHDISIQPDAYYFLRPEPDGWVVGLRERSQDSLMRWFRTEDEACHFLHERLLELPPSVPGGAERIEEALARGDEIQRKAWEDFERARRDSESPGKDEEPPAQS